jgi:hypothetical protein
VTYIKAPSLFSDRRFKAHKKGVGSFPSWVNKSCDGKGCKKKFLKFYARSDTHYYFIPAGFYREMGILSKLWVGRSSSHSSQGGRGGGRELSRPLLNKIFIYLQLQGGREGVQIKQALLPIGSTYISLRGRERGK